MNTSRFAFTCQAAIVVTTFAAAAAHGQSEPASRGGKLADVLQPYVDRHVIAGAVTLVADKDGVLDVEAFGMADIAANKPMTPDAVFWVASQTKPFTGTAMTMLIEEGKVGLDDSVEKYLPEFKGQMVLAEQDDAHRLLRKPAHPITVRNILTHTSGLPATSPVEYPTLDRLPLETAARSYAMLPLGFEPDTKFQYANAGLNTAGRIIEVVTHQSYEEFLRQRLLEPLGLQDTTFWPDASQVQRLAKSYQQDASGSPLKEVPILSMQFADLSDRVRRFAVPAGGLFSTAQDCGRFCQMIARRGDLDGKRYLSAASVDLMTSRQAPDASKGDYGLGWYTAWGRIGHDGAYSSSMSIDRKTGLVLIFLVQHAGVSDEVTQAADAFRHAAVERFGAGRTR